MEPVSAAVCKRGVVSQFGNLNHIRHSRNIDLHIVALCVFYCDLYTLIQLDCCFIRV